MLDGIHTWDHSTTLIKMKLLGNYLDNSILDTDLINYFDKYKEKLSNNGLNYYLKSVIET